MSFSPSFVVTSAVSQMFHGLGLTLDKAAAHAKENEIEESVYLNWRLSPDMFTMCRQVQIATEIPARALSRLAGADLPSFTDNEASFADLKARLADAKGFVDALDKQALDADPDGEITFPAGPGTEMTLPRGQYLMGFILPNLYFHTTAAYANLRSCGVPVGKMDYLGRG